MTLADGVDTALGSRDTPEDKPTLRFRNDIGCCDSNQKRGKEVLASEICGRDISTCQKSRPSKSLGLFFLRLLYLTSSTNNFTRWGLPKTAGMSEALLFENTFVIEAVNSQKYDRVSRINAHSEDNATFLMLDVNTELFPLAETERIKLALALTLNLDGSKDDTKGWREVGMGEQTLANEYDYVCHGKIYRFEEGHGDNMYGQQKRC
jgi:DNA-directed RNA polymerases I, II, and III subunit RPABC3